MDHVRFCPTVPFATLIVNMTVPTVNSLGAATRFTVSATRFGEVRPGAGTFGLCHDADEMVQRRALVNSVNLL